MTGYNPENERKTPAQETNDNISANEQEQNDSIYDNDHVETSSNEENMGAAEREINESGQPLAEKTAEESVAAINNNKFLSEGKKEEAIETKTVRETEIVEEYEEKTAGFWIRFLAFITDGLIVSAIVSILVKPIFYFLDLDMSTSDWFAPFTIISGIFYYGYFIIMTKFWQQTVGKMIFGLKVKSLKEEKLSWSTVLFRELVARFINNTVWLSYLAVAFTPKNRGIQDYIADTIVVQENVYVKNEKTVIREKIIEIDGHSNHQTA